MESENRKKIKELRQKRADITEELLFALREEVRELVRDYGEIDTAYIDNPQMPEKMFFNLENYPEIDGNDIENVELDLIDDQVTLVTDDTQYISINKVSINGLLYLIDCMDEQIKSDADFHYGR